jgi:hypothetical protein
MKYHILVPANIFNYFEIYCVFMIVVLSILVMLFKVTVLALRRGKGFSTAITLDGGLFLLDECQSGQGHL